jgi:D-serine deaminase-like pyridoxal phosphate-dependent protein
LADEKDWYKQLENMMNLDKAEIPTPAVLIDLPIVHRNIARMAAYAARQQLKLRPHSKTHKSLCMARLQHEAGASGLTVAKVGEAEVMAAVADDLLIAYPAFDLFRRSALAKLAGQKTVRVVLDSVLAIEALSAAATQAGSVLGILIDLDVGHHRTGVQSPDAALRLAQRVDGTSGLRLDGLICFPGHIVKNDPQQKEPFAQVEARLKETVDLWAKHGLAAKIVSGGSTPTAYQSHQMPTLTEIRPGTYIYNDMNTVLGKSCALEDCAARVVCTVVSDAVPGKVVIDAGSKTLSSDRNVVNSDAGFGHVVEYPQARIVRLTEEHGEVDISACDPRPTLGQRLHVIANHICPCINLHDAFWLRDGEEETYHRHPVEARGRVC